MRRAFILCWALTAALVSGSAAERVRVACLGDSITYGTRVVPERESYPVQLQAMLGPEFEVKNFGVAGATLWHGGPHNSFEQLPGVAAFAPAIAIVMFGVNDTRSEAPYWPNFAHFAPDAAKLLDSLLAQPGHPRVLLCLPTDSVSDLAGLTPERRSVLDERKPRHAKIRAVLVELAQRDRERGVELVDLFAATQGRREFFNADAVHFNVAGYRYIAEVLKPRVVALNPTRPAARNPE